MDSAIFTIDKTCQMIGQTIETNECTKGTSIIQHDLSLTMALVTISQYMMFLCL